MCITRGGTVDSNMQQPLYQVHAYGPGVPQLVSDTYFPMLLVFPTMIGGTHLGMSENVKEQAARTLRESLV
jgi:hypothetical protein